MDLIFKAPLNASYGYARVVDLLLEYLPKRDVSLHCISLQGVPDAKYCHFVRPIKKEILDSSKELIVFPISFDLYNRALILKLDVPRPRVVYTMWETSRINTFVVRELNEVSAIIVPCTWNKEVFQSCGVTAPIHVIPLATPKYFSYSPPLRKGFVFGTGNNDYRKRLKDVIRCFCRAFHPDIRDVKLKVKVSPKDNLGAYTDDRVEILYKDLTPTELFEWYESIDVFVSGAYAEGWGLMQHEAMACGRPLISPWYGGVKDFFNEQVGYGIDYEEVLADGPYEASGGFWANFSEKDMIEKMRWCYHNREDVYKKGVLAAEQVKNFTENIMIDKILAVVNYIQ